MRQRDKLDELADAMLEFIPPRSGCPSDELRVLRGWLRADETHAVVNGLSRRAQADDVLLPDGIMRQFEALQEQFCLEEEFEELREHQEALKKRLSDA